MNTHHLILCFFDVLRRNCQAAQVQAMAQWENQNGDPAIYGIAKKPTFTKTLQAPT
jgi:hypothetical protein